MTIIAKVRAPFVVDGKWKWISFVYEGPHVGNKYAAIVSKAAEIGATGWDAGSADQELVKS